MPAATHNGRWWSDATVSAMYADYKSGLNFVQVGKKYGVLRSSVRQAFVTRGLPLLPRPNAGCFKKERKIKTRAEILRIIDEMADLKLPKALAYDWRKWDWAKRRWFMDQVKDRRAPQRRRPTGPCSPGVVPFDYCTPAARAIVEAVNAGRDSQRAATKIHLCSEGVIFEEQLWFWNFKLGRYSTGYYHASTGRRECLHWHLYQRYHGPVPAGLVVSHADGNRNNFRPENLILKTRDQLVGENQATALAKKANLQTEALLRRQSSHLTTTQP